MAIEFLIAPPAESRFHRGVSKLKKILFYWLPPLLWMCLIFFASADVQSYQHSSRFFIPFMHWLFPHMSEEHIDAVHYLFRKTCHLTEYALFALLLWRAIRHTRRPIIAQKRSEGGWRWDEAGLALTIVFLYSASDELHQVFVPTRTGMVSDVFIDTGGGATGLLLLWVIGKIFKRW